MIAESRSIHVFKNFVFVFNNFTFGGLTSSQPSVMISAAELLKAAKTMEKPRGGIKLSSKAVKKGIFYSVFLLSTGTLGVMLSISLAATLLAVVITVLVVKCYLNWKRKHHIKSTQDNSFIVRERTKQF